jgi:hypothetical protein
MVTEMSDSDMASKLIAVVVEQRNQIVELESQISRIDKANTDLLGQYVEAAERARELEIELNAKPDPPEPEDEVKTVLCPDCGNVIEIASNATNDTYLGDFRVLKTAIEIVLYAKRQKRAEWELDLCRKTVLTIRTFTEEIRRWNGLDTLEPYKWSSLGNGEKYLIDREWKK